MFAELDAAIAAVFEVGGVPLSKLVVPQKSCDSTEWSQEDRIAWYAKKWQQIESLADRLGADMSSLDPPLPSLGEFTRPFPNRAIPDMRGIVRLDKVVKILRRKNRL